MRIGDDHLSRHLRLFHNRQDRARPCQIGNITLTCCVFHTVRLKRIAMHRRINATLRAASLLTALSVLTTAAAETAAWPPGARPLFTLHVPAGWRSSFVGAEERLHLTSPAHDAEIEAWALTGAASSTIDDVVARIVDSELAKAQFSNLHQRRQLNGISVVVFRGSGREKKRGRTVRFEFYSFPLADGGIGVLHVVQLATTPPRAREAAQSAVESLAIIDRHM